MSACPLVLEPFYPLVERHGTCGTWYLYTLSRSLPLATTVQHLVSWMVTQPFGNMFSSQIKMYFSFSAVIFFTFFQIPEVHDVFLLCLSPLLFSSKFFSLFIRASSAKFYSPSECLAFGSSSYLPSGKIRRADFKKEKHKGYQL